MGQTSSAQLHPVSRFFRLLGQDRQEMSYLYLYAAFGGLLNLSLPLGIQAIIGFTLANELSSSWGILVGLVTLGTLLAGILLIMQRALVERMQQKLFVRAAFEFAYRIPLLKREALLKYYPPELVNRFFDTLNLQKGLPKLLIEFVTAILQIGFGMLLLSFYHPLFVFFGLGLFLLLTLIIRISGTKALASSLQESDAKYKVAYWLEEVARALSTFKLAGKNRLALTKTDNEVSRYLTKRKRHFRSLVFQYSSIIVFKTLITASLLILGSILLIQREINLGQFVASEIIIILIINSVEKLVMSADTVYDVLTATEKIAKVTDLPIEQYLPSESAIQIDKGQGLSVHMKQLRFRFPDAEQEAIQDINLSIKAGEKIAVIGANGSGKTIFLNLVSGLFDEHRGVLAYNDIPRGNFDMFTLREHIGDCLPQQQLFKGSLRENITMGNPQVQESDIRWALTELGLWPYVQSLAQGLETELVPESIQMPDSIRRKIILAQAVVRRPGLLVVDNLFLALNKAERIRIFDFLTQCPDWTLIMASNDTSLCERCDRVLVLDKGQQVNIAPFEELQSLSSIQDLF